MAATPFKAFEAFDIVLAKDIVLGRDYGTFRAGTPGTARYRPNGTIMLISYNDYSLRMGLVPIGQT